MNTIPSKKCHLYFQKYLLRDESGVMYVDRLIYFECKDTAVFYANQPYGLL